MRKTDALKTIMDFYDKVICTEERHKDLHWCATRKRFTLDQANAFFLGILLDQGQDADRAWNGGRHFVDNYFTGRKGFWREIDTATHSELQRICTTGYNGTSYGSRFTTNRLSGWLKSNAKLMIDIYDQDPRYIWNVNNGDFGVIYDRFITFHGVGDALAKMATFILVRNYGIAGEKKSQSKSQSTLSVKPDIHIRRVLARLGLSKDEKLSSVRYALDSMNLDRPVDLDASLWVVGREWCYKTDPHCVGCPLKTVCPTPSNIIISAQ